MEVLKLTIQFMMMSDSPVIRRCTLLRRTTSHSQTSTRRRSALAGHLTAHHVQAVSVGVQVLTRLCTAVSCRAMCTGRRRHGAPQSARILLTQTYCVSSKQNEEWSMYQNVLYFISTSSTVKLCFEFYRRDIICTNAVKRYVYYAEMTDNLYRSCVTCFPA